MPIDAIADSAGSGPLGPDLASGRPERSPQPKAASEPVPQTATAEAPAAVSSNHEVSVMVDENNRIIYRFVNQRTGEVAQQVPPEELLRVMQNIAEWLRSSGSKVDVVS